MVDSKESLGNLFVQLKQARDEEVVDPTINEKRSPDCCLFFTPYPISPTVWDKFHKFSQELSRENIEIIDGSRLMDLIRDNIPHILHSFSPESRYLFNLEDSANNIPESRLAFDLKKELSLEKIYVKASLDSANLFFERFIKYPLKLQGPKLLYIETDKLSQVEELGKTFGKNAIILDSTQIKDESIKKELIELNKKLGRNAFQIDLDPLLVCAQKRARETVENLTKLSVENLDDCAKTTLEYIKIKEALCELQDSDSILDYWISFIDSKKKAEWTKPKITIPSDLLQNLDCNQYILGGPGAGKTTLLRRLTQNHVKTKNKTLPLYLPLVFVKEASEEALVESCIQQLENHGFEFRDDANPTKAFLNKLSAGLFHLYLDGLDETGLIALDLFYIINKIGQKYPKSRITLSCRSTFQTPNFKNAFELKLTPFSEKQLHTFLENWFDSQPTALKNIKEWLKENEKIKQAATSPIVAALLCSLFYIKAEMPTTEMDLYEKRFELLLGKWDTAKGIRRIIQEIMKRYWRFITELAWDMHFRGTRSISFSEANAFAEKYCDAKLDIEPSELVRDCVHRGILEYETFEGLSFGHLTNQEFLVARKLSMDNDLSFIVEMIDDPWWQNAIKFYASIKYDITPLLKQVSKIEIEEDTVAFLYELVDLAPWTDLDVFDTI